MASEVRIVCENGHKPRKILTAQRIPAGVWVTRLAGSKPLKLTGVDVHRHENAYRSARWRVVASANGTSTHTFACPLCPLKAKATEPIMLWLLDQLAEHGGGSSVQLRLVTVMLSTRGRS